MRRSIYLLFTKWKFIILDYYYFPWFLIFCFLSHALALADQDFSLLPIWIQNVRRAEIPLSDGIPFTQAAALSAQMQLCFPLIFPHWNQVLRVALSASISLKRLEEFWWKRKDPPGRCNRCLSVLPWCISVGCWVLYYVTALLLETASSGRCKHNYFRREAQWAPVGVPNG